MSAVSITQETINPTTAAKWLAANPANRNIRASLVDAITRDIAEGRWVFNGESIKIAEDGTLIDGQHRLAAVVKADKPVESIVVRGLGRETQRTIDSGNARTFGDTLRLDGEKYYTALASMVRTSWLLDVTGSVSQGRTRPSSTELNAYLAKNPTIRDWAPIASQSARSAIKTPMSIMALGFQMSLLDNEAAKEFWRQLLENDAKKGSAVFVLREQLIRDRMASHPSSVIHRAALITKAWNLWMEGKEPALIGWRPGVEDFPRLRAAAKTA